LTEIYVIKYWRRKFFSATYLLMKQIYTEPDASDTLLLFH